MDKPSNLRRSIRDRVWGRLLRTKTIKYIFIRSGRRLHRHVHHHHTGSGLSIKWIVGGALAVTGVNILYFWWQYIVVFFVLLLHLGALGKSKRK